MQDDEKKEVFDGRNGRALRKGTDGELIHLNMYCDLCGWNKTGQPGFYLQGKEYCVTCYPLMVNAYLATQRLENAKGKGSRVRRKGRLHVLGCDKP